MGGRTRLRAGTWAVAAVLLMGAACTEPGDDSHGIPDARDTVHGDGGADADADDGSSDVPRRVTRMRGTVWSPGGVVPISGALVYFTMTEPPAIPPGAYPDACVDPPSSFFIRSNPDGTFELDVVPGAYRLVTQKGQFRRVRDITVPDSDTPVDIDFLLTTLPARSDEAVGDTIPHIALVWALEGGDHIEDVLAKLTMGDLSGDRLVRGSEPFDLYNIAPYEPNTALLESLDRMLEYHIIFFPCTIAEAFGGIQLNDPTGPLTDPAVLDNLRAFATAGGKIYATDMMYDIFERPMPVYVDICGDDAVLNDGDETAWVDSRTASGWTSYGQSIDADLSAWLDAVGIGSTGLSFDGNFVWIERLLDTVDPLPSDPQPPKVWVTGNFVLDLSRTLPLTITFPYGAGKVLFSTYHTEGGGGHPDLLPQEYVLVYLIMEIGVCQSPLL